MAEDLLSGVFGSKPDAPLLDDIFGPPRKPSGAASAAAGAAASFSGASRIEPVRPREESDSALPGLVKGAVQIMRGENPFNMDVDRAAREDAQRRADVAAGRIEAPDTWGEFWGTAGTRGWAQLKSHYSGVLQQLAEGKFTEGVSAVVDPKVIQFMAIGAKKGLEAAHRSGSGTDLSIQEAAWKDLEANQFSRGNPEAMRYAGMVTDSAALMIPTMAVTFATKNPAAGASLLGIATMGEQYGHSRAEGRSTSAAQIDGIVYGLAEAVPELLPLSALMKPGGKFLWNTLKVAGLEGASEVATAAVQTGYDMGVLDKDMTWGQAWERIQDAGIVGFLMGGAMSTVSAPIQRKIIERRAAAEQAIQRQIETNAAAVEAMSTPDALGRRVNPDDRRQYAPALGPRTAPTAPGIVETALSDVGEPTPEDEASPLPTEAISQGRRLMDQARAGFEADSLLARHGAPATGSPVRVNFGNRVVDGIVEDAFDTDGEAGVKIRLADGTVFDEYFSTIREAGISIEAVEEAAPVVEAPAPRPSQAAPVRQPATGASGLNPSLVGGLKSRGFSEAQARGIAAGIHAESRGDPTIINPTSGAFGIGQWLGSRKTEIRRRYGPNPTLDQQLDFLAWELRGGDHGGKAVLSKDNEVDVLHSYIKDFMRPAQGAETTGDISRGLAVLGRGGDIQAAGESATPTPFESTLPDNSSLMEDILPQASKPTIETRPLEETRTAEPAPLAEPVAAEPEPSPAAALIEQEANEPRPSIRVEGAKLILRDLSPVQRVAVDNALPGKARALPRADGSFTVPKRHEETVRAAVDFTLGESVPNIAPEPVGAPLSVETGASGVGQPSVVAPIASAVSEAAQLPASAPVTVQIGERSYPFTSYEEVSRAYRATIDKLDIGASETPSAKLYDASGNQVGHVSYNGKVWAGTERDWKPRIAPIYDPSGTDSGIPAAPAVEAAPAAPAPDLIPSNTAPLSLDRRAPPPAPEPAPPENLGAAHGPTQEQIGDLVKTFGEGQSSRAFAVMMTPDQFLGLTSNAQGRAEIERRTREMAQYGGGTYSSAAAQAEGAIGLGVDLSEDGSRVISHAGRHRMTMLKKQGVKQVLVRIYANGAKADSDFSHLELLPQLGNKKSQVNAGDTPTVLTDLVPFSEANVERLRRIVDESKADLNDVARIGELLGVSTGEASATIDALRERPAGREQAGEELQGAVRALAKRRGVTLDDGDIRNAIRHMEGGSSVEAALEMAVAQAQIAVLDDLADASQLEYDYADVAQSIYEGFIAEQRDRGPETGRERSDRAEGVEGASRGAASERSRDAEGGSGEVGATPVAGETATTEPVEAAEAEQEPTAAPIEAPDPPPVPAERVAGSPIAEAKAALRKAMEALDEAAPEVEAAVPTAPRILHQRVAAPNENPVFYSKLERVVERASTARASAEQWSSTLAAAGVKREELEWSGVLDWLAMQEGPVERDALLGVIRDGGIQVEEVVLGAERPEDDRYDAMNTPNSGGLYPVIGPNGEFQGEYDSFEEAEREAAALNGTTGPAQFASWSSDPNSDSYRELLIRLPLGVRGNPGRAPATHWEQEDVVAHARFMEKRDAEGKRVLFIEEVQSDWHQKGRDEGYERELSETELAARDQAQQEARIAYEAARDALFDDAIGAHRRHLEGLDYLKSSPDTFENVHRNFVIRLRDVTLAEDQRLRQAEQFAAPKLRDAVHRTKLTLLETMQAASRRAEGSIPEAPFKSTWPALVMKRMIRWAADNGFDRIAWTTGEEQSARYNLSQAIDTLNAERLPDGRYEIGTGKAGVARILYEQGMASEENVKGLLVPVMTTEQLKQAFGENISKQVVEGTEDGKIVTLRDENLRVGGEGMRQFYDRNLVNITNDIIKKYGARVGPVQVKKLSDYGTPRFSAESNLHAAEQSKRVVDALGGEAGVRAKIKELSRKKGDDAFVTIGEDRRNEVIHNAESLSAILETADHRRVDEYREALNAYPLPANPGFDITPALREAATGGFPLFKRSAVALKPVDEATSAQWREKLQASLRRMKIEDRVLLDVASTLDAGPNIAGQYWRGTIGVALAVSENPTQTFGHEAWHALEEMGMFRPAEQTAVAKAVTAGRMKGVRERYPDLSPANQMKEAKADLFGDWLAQRAEAKGLVAKAFQRVKDLFVAIRDALRGEVSAEGVFRNIERGRIGEREAAPEQEDARPIQSRTMNRDTETVTADTSGGGSRSGGPPVSTSPAFNDPDTESRWREASKGLGDGPGLIERAKGWWDDIATGFSRHWRDLPNEPRFADVGQQLRKLEASPTAAKERTVRMLSSIVEGMSREKLDLFTRKVVLDDLTWEADAERQLPFGFTPETLAVEKAKIDRIVEQDPAMVAAVRKRKLLNRQVAEEMAEAGVLNREQIRNPAYFRHMVLDYARAEMRLAKGAGSKVKSPYWAKRMGSSLDINVNLLEAEFEWLQKAQVDIATAKLIDWIKKSEHNIREDLAAKAKAHNDEAVQGLLTGEGAAQDKAFRETIATGLKQVSAAIEADELGIIPKHLQGAAEAVREGKDHGRTIPLLAWMLDESKPGASGAATVLKATGQRKAWERALLGNRYINPNDSDGLVKALAPDGYKAWQPIAGRHLFTAKTVPEHILDGFVEKLSAPHVPGISADEMHRALSSVKEQLVVGGERYTMIIPEEIADTLTEFGDRRAEGLFSQGVQLLQGSWKRWVLINPRRFLKYNINNMSGDLDALIAGNPSTLLKVKQAATELYAVMRKGQKPSARYEEAVERGVFDSGLTIQEIPDITRLSAFRHLTDDHGSARPDKLLAQAAGSIWRALQGTTQFRENIFRYAAYLDYAEKIEAGRPTGYGASVPRIVDAVTDPKDRAALLARDLIGDYGAISVAGGWLRRHLIPFWSWTEINSKRYWRLTSNAYSQGVGRGIATGGALALSAGVRKSATLIVRMGLIYGLMMLWNNLFFGDEEDELGEQQQRQLHLIMGRDANGQVITMRLQGALSDIFSTFGITDGAAALKKYLDGQGSLGSVAGSVATAPINKVATGVNPFISVPIEQATGKEYWPDIFNARDIHDRWRHVFSTLSLENEYDVVAGKPSRGYDRSWAESIVYRRDPGEMAYDEAKGIAYDWLAREKGESSTGGRITPRGEALREYRMAIRYGDKDAAASALERFYEFGGKEKGLKSSIKRSHPLGPISKKDRRAFLDSLTDEQYETFREAERWYDEVYLDR